MGNRNNRTHTHYTSLQRVGSLEVGNTNIRTHTHNTPLECVGSLEVGNTNIRTHIVTNYNCTINYQMFVYSKLQWNTCNVESNTFYETIGTIHPDIVQLPVDVRVTK